MFAICLVAASQPAQAAWQDAREVLDSSGISGGLIVHVGCGDGQLTAELGEGEGFLVHGLDTDPADVARARELIDSKGLYGRVSVDLWDGERLPYIDNFANLILIEGYKSVPKEELLRVLCPTGSERGR
jgi:SAM-dependent methyltransferase